MANTPMKMSPAGLPLTKAYEQCRLVVYLDQARRPTIYWGHLIRSGERFNHTQSEADTILVQDLNPAEACVNAFCVAKANHPITQSMFDAMVDFTFNAGGKAFQTSTLCRLAVAGDFNGAALQFLRWVHEHDALTGQLIESPGLEKRRQAESNLFLGKPWVGP